MFWYKIPGPGEAMLISGRGVKTGDAPFKVVTGNGAFVFPFFRRAAFLGLGMQEANVQERCFSRQGIELDITAVMAFQVGTLDTQIVNAGRSFIADQGSMETRVGKIFAGHLRSIVGSMTVEDIIRERQTLADHVLQASKKELDDIGLIVPSFQIESVNDIAPDGQRGVYISAMARPHNAEIQKQARVAEAENNRAAAEAEQQAQRQQAGYARETSMTQAGYNAEVQKANATATAEAEIASAEADQRTEVARATAQAEIGEATAERDRRQRVAQARSEAEIGTETAKAQQAGPLAQATASHEVAIASTALAEQQALQREQELKRDVVAPANADAQRRLLEAQAEAQATELAATALASSNRVQVDMELVRQLPAVASAVASELRGANLTVLNGAEGLTEIATGAIAQAKVIYETMRQVRATAGSENGQAPQHELEATR